MAGRSRWRRWARVFRRDPRVEVEDELAFHLEERVRDYIERGLDPASARRAALERLGDVERVRDTCTGLLAEDRLAEERRMWLRVSWLDVKLGVRMLAKYPAMSLVSVLGMAAAIAIGAGMFAAIEAYVNPVLPLDEGDRIVSIQNNQVDAGNPDRQAAFDFGVWRRELTSVRDLSAFVTASRNLVDAAGNTRLVRVAEMTASGFRVARVAPLLGRALLDTDEREGASPVVVIAYEEWQRRFDADPDILRRMIRLGGTMHAVVGVMPQGFRFPVYHRYWVPLQLPASSYPTGGGPALFVFGRLADGATFARVQAELSAIGGRLAEAYPETHARLRSVVLPYTHPFANIDSPATQWAFQALVLAISMVLAVVAANVAILVYARTAARAGEIAVRTALGASRRRIVAQLFTEALVLSAGSAALGLTIAGVGLALVQRMVSQTDWTPPFWLHHGLTPGVVVYAVVLAVAAGVIVGVLPGLQATRRIQAALQELGTRGSQMQLGRTWTALIIAQVAIAVAALPVAMHVAAQAYRFGSREPASTAYQLLRANLTLDRPEPPPGADAVAYQRETATRLAQRASDLLQRLQAEPEVSGATLATSFPGVDRWRRIDIEGAAAPTGNGHAPAPDTSNSRWVRMNDVDLDLFDVFDAPILSGRGFVASDAREGATAVVVNRTFADWIAGGANVVGRRIRYASNGREGDEAGPWLEIVGVVPDFARGFTAPNAFDPVPPRVYRALVPGSTAALNLIVRVRAGAPAAFAGRLRNIAADIDPTLTLDRLVTVLDTWDENANAMWLLALAIIAGTASVLLLSAAGIYAMMSFAVTKRRREIGIRAALGAQPRRVLTGVLARAAAQLGAGIMAGLLVSTGVQIASPDLLGEGAAGLLAGVAALMVCVGLLATLGPARRGLAVQPTEALRAE